MRDQLGKEELFTRFLAAHEDACEWIRRDPAASAGIVARTTGLVDQAFVLMTYRISPKYCAALPPEYIASTMKFVQTLYSLGYISRPVKKEEIFETSLVEKVHPRPHHYLAGISGA